MKIILPSYEILTDISPFGICELEQIERAARICYKSEDKYQDQAESAKKLIKKLIANGHEAMLEHSTLSVKFICDRGVSHELVRHRLASFAQESTRYCNYMQDKFGNELTFIDPCFFSISDVAKANVMNASPEELHIDPYFTDDMKAYRCWVDACKEAEIDYLSMLVYGCSPQEARAVLPNSLKTEVVITANYREWRHILKLRTDKAAHPQMRELMVPLLKDLYERIPVIFDDIYENRRD